MGELTTRSSGSYNENVDGGFPYAQFLSPRLRRVLDDIARKHKYHPIHIHKLFQIEFELAYMQRRHGLLDRLSALAEVEPDSWQEAQANDELEYMLSADLTQRNFIRFVRLSVVNYGVFLDATIRFSDDVNRPITLVGGQTGYGKTTLFSSILTALYGFEEGWQRHKDGAPVPHQCSNKSCEVSTSLTWIEYPKKEETTLNRTYHYTKGAANTYQLERTTVHIQRGSVSLDNPQEIDAEVERILPKALSQYFFFDADAIRAFHTSQARALRQGLERALGLEIADTIRKDLLQLQKKYDLEVVVNKDIQASIRRLDAEIKDVTKEEAQLHTAEKELRNKLSLTAEELAEAKDKLNSFRKYLDPKQIEYYNRLINDRGVIQGKISSRSNELDRFVSEELAISLSRLFFERALSLSQVESDGIRRAAIEAYERAKQVFSTKNYSLDDLTYIFSPLSQFTSDEITTARLGLGERDKKCLADCIKLSRSGAYLSSLIWDLHELDGELIAIQAKLQTIKPPDDTTSREMQDAQEQYEKLYKDHEFQAGEQKRIAQKLRAVEEEKARLEDERESVIRKAVTVSTLLHKRDRAKAFCAMAIEAIDAISMSKISELEELTTTVLNRLTNKPDLIRKVIFERDTLAATIVEDNRKSSFNELSEGEKQIAAMSMIAALAQLSGHRFPIVIDTPFGRLDKAYRTRLSEDFLKNVSHQVVVLSTDQELVGDYLDEIKEAVGRKYLIVRASSGDEESTIKEDYYS